MKYKITTVYTVTKTTHVEFESVHPECSDEFNDDYAKAERDALIKDNPNVDVDSDIEIFDTTYEVVK